MTIGHTIVGSGPEKILVLQGWFGDYLVWEPTFNALDTNSFTYVFMDYRGYGKSKGRPTEKGLYKDAEENKSITRRAADRIFLIAMKIYGVGIIKRRIIYWAVRAAGRLAFRKQPPRFSTNNHHKS